MKYFIVFAFSLLMNSYAVCQTDFISDTSDSNESFTLDSLLNTSAGLDTSFDFELRLWSEQSLTGFLEVFVLTRKSSAWHARYFELRKGRFVERSVNQAGLDSLWAGISYHQVLSLPDQNSIRARMRKYSADSLNVFIHDSEYRSMTITDGTNYRFELFGKGKRRTYQYHCPATYLKYYPNIEELYRAYAIIIYIRKHLKLQLTSC